MTARSMTTRSMKKLTSNGSFQKQEFVDSLKTMLQINSSSQDGTYKGTIQKLNTCIEISKYINKKYTSVYPELFRDNPYSAGKLLSVMYLKMYELISKSLIISNVSYLISKEQIDTIERFAINFRENARKTLFLLFDIMNNIYDGYIQNYDIIKKHHQELIVSHKYNLRRRKSIYYGEQDDDDNDINQNMVSICKRRFEDGKVVYRWSKMTKDEAEKKYDEDYVYEEN